MSDPSDIYDSAKDHLDIPILIDHTPALNSGTNWIGNTTVAVDLIMDQLPRIVTMPGNIEDADIRSAVKIYMRMVTEMLAAYLPVAAFKGYSAAVPQMSGYIDNYLAKTGAKPWEIRNMTTLFRDVLIPTKLLGFMIDYYAIIQHPRVANIHHYMPMIGSTTAEAKPNSGSTNVPFSTVDVVTAIKAKGRADIDALSGNKMSVNEITKWLKMAGYNTYEMPVEIPVVASAEAWERKVDQAPQYVHDVLDASAHSYGCLPTAGHQDRLLTCSGYTADLGPNFARGIAPVYSCGKSAGWQSEDQLFVNANSAANRPSLNSTGQHAFAGASAESTPPIVQNGFSFIGYGITAGDGVPFSWESKGTTLTPEEYVALGRIVSRNRRVLDLATDDTQGYNYWTNAVDGNAPLAGTGQLYRSSTIDPNTYDVNTGVTNRANIQLIYESLFLA